MNVTVLMLQHKDIKIMDLKVFMLQYRHYPMDLQVPVLLYKDVIS